MKKNLVQSKLLVQSKDLEKMIEPIVKNPIIDFDKSQTRCGKKCNSEFWKEERCSTERGSRTLYCKVKK